MATISIKQSALKSFTETTAKFVLVFTGIMLVFAVAIAVGVVYNHARVALAERAWELASLRVLRSKAEYAWWNLPPLPSSLHWGLRNNG